MVRATIQYTMFHEFLMMFFANIVCLDIETCFGNNKNILFLNSTYKIIVQEMNKTAIHTHCLTFELLQLVQARYILPHVRSCLTIYHCGPLILPLITDTVTHLETNFKYGDIFIQVFSFESNK